MQCLRCAPLPCSPSLRALRLSICFFYPLLLQLVSVALSLMKPYECGKRLHWWPCFPSPSSLLFFILQGEKNRGRWVTGRRRGITYIQLILNVEFYILWNYPAAMGRQHSAHRLAQPWDTVGAFTFIQKIFVVYLPLPGSDVGPGDYGVNNREDEQNMLCRELK